MNVAVVNNIHKTHTSLLHLLHQLIDGTLSTDRVEQLANEILGAVKIEQLTHSHRRVLRPHGQHIRLLQVRAGRFERSVAENVLETVV